MRLRLDIFINILFFIIGNLFAQTVSTKPLRENGKPLLPNNNLRQWEQVDELERQKKTRSALELISKIREQSLAEHNSPEYIKSILASMVLNDRIAEEKGTLNMAVLRESIREAKFPVKNILQSILADLYLQYNNFTRNNIHTKWDADEVGDAETDYKNMRIDKLTREIITLYSESLSNPDSLKNIRIDEYINFLRAPNRESREIYSSLFDLLNTNALSSLLAYRKAIERVQVKKDYSEEDSIMTVLCNTFKFLPLDEFLTSDFKSYEKFPIDYSIFKIMQSQLNTHKNDSDKTALIFFELQRVDYYSQHLSEFHSSKEFEDYLSSLIDKYSSCNASSLINYIRAKIYYTEKSLEYDKYLKQAVDECNKAIAKGKNTIGGLYAEKLKDEILNKSIIAQFETNLSPQKPSLMYIGYKNIDTVFIRIIRDSINNKYRFWNYFDHDRAKYYERLMNTEPIKEFIQVLPVEDDFADHSTEIIIPPLPLGAYTIFLSTHKDFNSTEAMVVTGEFQVTNLALSIFNSGSKVNVLITDCRSGEPVNDAIVKYSVEPPSKVQKFKFGGNTDKNGIFSLDQEYVSAVIIAKEKDTLAYYSNNLGNQNFINSNIKNGIFTDRVVYRPGDTVKFKGISAIITNFEPSVLYNRNYDLFIKNPEGKNIFSNKYTTNRFGSFDGKFCLPKSSQPGRYSISFESAYFYFQIEEYKTPKLTLTNNPVADNIFTGDTIKISGFLRTYAGYPAGNAKIVYTAKEENSYPKIYNGNENIYGNQNGNIYTDSNGNYTISLFPLKPGKKNNQKNRQATISLDITATDETGESCTLTEYITVIPPYPFINITAPKNALVNEPYKAIIKVLSIRETPLKSDIIVRVYKLEEQNKITFERRWSRPDRFVIPEAEYAQFSLSDGVKKQLPDRDAVPVYETRVKTDGKYELICNQGKDWKEGSYLLDIMAVTNDSLRNSSSRVLTLWNPNSDKITGSGILKIFGLKTKAESCDTAKIIVGSSLKNQHAFYFILRGNEIIKKEWITLNNEQKIINIPVTKQDRGNLFFKIITFYGKNIVTEGEVIEVPWSDKELKITFETFRDKLKPGNLETWKVRVNDYKKLPANAEILAAMYDASLDVYLPHKWLYSPLTTYSYKYDPSEFQYSLSNAHAFLFKYINSTKQVPDIKPFNINYYGLFFNTSPVFSPNNISNNESLITYTPVLRHEPKTLGMVNNRLDEGVDYCLLSVKDYSSIPSDNTATGIYSMASKDESIMNSGKAVEINVRKDFNPTSFFYPAIYTQNGAAEISFTVPDAITKWKFMLLAHTKDMSMDIVEKEVITQKDFSIQMNLPRFLRSGDTLKLAAGINNISGKQVNGNALLTLTDEKTGQILNTEFALNPSVVFTSLPGQRCTAEWQIIVPEGITSSLLCKVIASGDNFSDGEQNKLQVLSNRIEIKEGIPVHVKAKTSKTVKLPWFSYTSSTMRKNSLLFEFTSNPAWLVKDALASVIEYPWDCCEQVFNKYFCSKIAGQILTGNNDSLQVKGKIPHGIDSIFAQNSPEEFYNRIKNMRNNSGAWGWFPGMRDNLFFTCYILEGFGKLKAAGLLDKSELVEVEDISSRGFKFAEESINQEVHRMNFDVLYYFYARSYYDALNPAAKNMMRYNETVDYIKNTWPKLDLSEQIISALALYNYGIEETASDIMNSIKENAVYNNETGMHFNNNSPYPVFSSAVTHSLITLGFEKILHDSASVYLLKTWLLNIRQTANWGTTVDNAAAAYIMAVNNISWLTQNKLPELKLGGKEIDIEKHTTDKSHTGQVKITWNKEELPAYKSPAIIKNNNNLPAWGGFIFQYSEESAKILKSKSGLDISRKFFIKKTIDGKDVLSPIESNVNLKSGDLIVVRLYISVNKDIDYVHIEDMRGAGFEPDERLSGVKYNNGLFLFETIKDISTNFFIEHLEKGKYVIEYPIRANIQGVYNLAPATIQSMYAPVFTSHTGGNILNIKK